jgi:hypothetical protein
MAPGRSKKQRGCARQKGTWVFFGLMQKKTAYRKKVGKAERKRKQKEARKKDHDGVYVHRGG